MVLLNGCSQVELMSDLKMLLQEDHHFTVTEKLPHWTLNTSSDNMVLTEPKTRRTPRANRVCLGHSS